MSPNALGGLVGDNGEDGDRNPAQLPKPEGEAKPDDDARKEIPSLLAEEDEQAEEPPRS